MRFGIRHSDKCTKEEISAFSAKVAEALIAAGADMSKLRTRALTSFGGHVRIYTGGHEERIAKRTSLKHVKDNGDGSSLYERSKSIISEPVYTSIYRTDDWSSELNHLSEFLAEHMLINMGDDYYIDDSPA